MLVDGLITQVGEMGVLQGGMRKHCLFVILLAVMP